MKNFIVVALFGAFQLNASKTSSYAGKPLPEVPKKTAAARPLPPLPKIPKISDKQLIEAIDVEDEDNKDLVRKQLEAYPELIEVVDESRNNPLMIALESEVDDPDFILELLSKTKNLEHRNKYGETALIKAARYPYHAVLEALLKRGAKVEVVNNDGQTPLAAAAVAQNADNINLLLKAGAPMDVKTLLRAIPGIYPPELIAQIVQKAVPDIAVKKLPVEDISPQWRETLGKFVPMLQKLFAVTEQLKKEVDATQRVADTVVFIYVDHTERVGGIVSKEFSKALADGGMIIIATTHVIVNALHRLPGQFVSANWDMRLADESGHIVVLFPKEKGKEFSYGIKRDQMRPVSPEELREMHKKHGPGQYPDRYLIPALPKIFVTRKEYAQQKPTEPMPRFAFYVEGHGELNAGLSGLSIESFQSLLNFLETQVKTVFFAYTSCFAVGTNTQALFQDVRTNLTGKTYSFPIATNGKIDDLTYTGLEYANYRSVVLLLTQETTLDLTKILPALFGDITPIQPAFVRFPGMSWFVPFDAVTKSISIAFPLVAGRTEPLRVQDQLLLLYENVVPFELKIMSAGRFPHFLSMRPGTAIHYFTSVDIGSNDFLQFIRHMTKELPQRRLIFWIKRLSSSKPQKGIFQGTQLLEDVVFEFTGAGDGDPSASYVHFIKNNTPYWLEGDRLVQRADHRPAFEKLFLDTMGESLAQSQESVAKIQKNAQDLGRLLQQRKEKAGRAAAPGKTVVGVQKARKANQTLSKKPTLESHQPKLALS